MKENNGIPGKGAATASLALGIINIVFWFFVHSSLLSSILISIIVGIIGLFLAGKSKRAGFTGGIRTAGFVLSLISAIRGSLSLALLAALVVCIGMGL